MTPVRSQEAEMEEAILNAEMTILELEQRGTDHHRCEARWLEKMTRAVRLALVARVDVGVLTRLHLRLETSLRRATTLLAEPDELPPSQRPTIRPPGAWPPDSLHPQSGDIASDSIGDPVSQRPTLVPVLPATALDESPPRLRRAKRQDNKEIEAHDSMIVPKVDPSEALEIEAKSA